MIEDYLDTSAAPCYNARTVGTRPHTENKMNIKEFLDKYGTRSPNLIVHRLLDLAFQGKTTGPGTTELILAVQTMMNDLESALQDERMRK